MIRDFLSLKLRLLANAFRRSPWQIVGLVLALAYGLGITILAVVTLVLLRFAEVDVARATVVIVGSALVLGFALVPLAFGVDDTLDPRRFALFGIDNTRLAVDLALRRPGQRPLVRASSSSAACRCSPGPGTSALRLRGAGGRAGGRDLHRRGPRQHVRRRIPAGHPARARARRAARHPGLRAQLARHHRARRAWTGSATASAPRRPSPTASPGLRSAPPGPPRATRPRGTTGWRCCAS